MRSEGKDPGRYLITKRDAKKRITSVLFPRYHQLDATRKLVQAVLAEGAGSLGVSGAAEVLLIGFEDLA